MGLSEEAQIAMTLGSLQAQLNTSVKEIGKIDDRISGENGFSGRIRKLEDAKLRSETTAGLISAIVSAIISLAAFLLGKFL